MRVAKHYLSDCYLSFEFYFVLAFLYANTNYPIGPFSSGVSFEGVGGDFGGGRIVYLYRGVHLYKVCLGRGCGWIITFHKWCFCK